MMLKRTWSTEIVTAADTRGDQGYKVSQGYCYYNAAIYPLPVHNSQLFLSPVALKSSFSSFPLEWIMHI